MTLAHGRCTRRCQTNLSRHDGSAVVKPFESALQLCTRDVWKPDSADKGVCVHWVLVSSRCRVLHGLDYAAAAVSALVSCHRPIFIPANDERRPIGQITVVSLHSHLQFDRAGIQIQDRVSCANRSCRWLLDKRCCISKDEAGNRWVRLGRRPKLSRHRESKCRAGGKIDRGRSTWRRRRRQRDAQRGSGLV